MKPSEQALSISEYLARQIEQCADAQLRQHLIALQNQAIDIYRRTSDDDGQAGTPVLAPRPGPCGPDIYEAVQVRPAKRGGYDLIVDGKTVDHHQNWLRADDARHDIIYARLAPHASYALTVDGALAVLASRELLEVC